MNKHSVLNGFLADLDEDPINWERFQDRCFQGVPDEKGLRSLSWRLLLGYLPLSKSGWSETLTEKRVLYGRFVNEFVVQASCSAEEPTNSAYDIDHPLSLNPGSQWQTFFKDNEVLSQVDKDVRRLYPAISFFQRATEFPNTKVVSGNCTRLHHRVERSGLASANLKRQGLGIQKFETKRPHVEEDYAALSEGSEAHWEVVERILFVYAKLNPGQGYVQGMNEIIGPIYYTFASDPNLQWREHAEADCFFCFTHLMSEIRDFFIKTLDGSPSGIGNMMAQVMDQLNQSDPAVHLKLEELDIKPQYFCFRWLTLLLSQEFDLPDILRIWDSLFADRQRFRFLIFFCCAMIMLIRDDLLSGDFSCCMKLLQNLFSQNQDFHEYSTRNARQLPSAPRKTTRASFIIKHLAPGVWNSIPEENFPPMDVHIILDKALQLSESNA